MFSLIESAKLNSYLTQWATPKKMASLHALIKALPGHCFSPRLFVMLSDELGRLPWPEVGGFAFDSSTASSSFST